MSRKVIIIFESLVDLINKPLIQVHDCTGGLQA